MNNMSGQFNQPPKSILKTKPLKINHLTKIKKITSTDIQIFLCQSKYKLEICATKSKLDNLTE